MKDGVVFVLFGVTGDLVKRKIIPAIYNLVRNKTVKKFHIIGVARKDLSMKEIILSSKTFIKNPDSKILKEIEKNSEYVQLDFFDSENYIKLKKAIENIEAEGYQNKIFHFAAPSETFEAITDNLFGLKIADANEKNFRNGNSYAFPASTPQHRREVLNSVGNKGFSRVVYEKPFGTNLNSAKKLNKCVKFVFNENQIYRLDHYLGKEFVENISIVRFTNRILEPLWNRNHIESVQIILNETLGVESRGGFYDKYGAVKDVVQNHMLQLLALTAMEAPRQLSGEYLRNEKVKVLKKTKIKDYILGQYKGYRNEKNADKNSRTETFAALKLEVNNPRWKGVDFFLKTGKKLAKRETKIIIKFKKAKCLLTKSCPSDSNYLEIRIQPDEGISFGINTKAPGGKNIITPVKMDFCHSCIFGPNTPDAYQKLFEDIINGDNSVFVGSDEIEESWRIVERIKKGEPFLYSCGSEPAEMERWNAKNKFFWK